MDFPYSIILNSEEETAAFASRLAGVIIAGNIVCLNGGLGTGKTFLVKKICAEYGIYNVSSPSFAIVNEYHNGKKIIHFDFYRIRKVGELYDLGIEDYFGRGDSILFIEWADLFTEVLPKKHLDINISPVDFNSRLITVKNNE
jgi:tRNA threonylcarbamoyladenosine biosynthesis protein TsaE